MQPLTGDDPEAIGPYRLLGRLGSGGMGRVYLARSGGGRTVAVKVVHPHFATDEEFRARFRREVDSARRVGTGPEGHRWSAPVLDADPEAAVPWVATGYVAGPSLTEAVQRHGPLPEASVRALGAGLAEALAAVHALHLVHRDVKPSNVLLSLDGPRLIDFGIARATDGTASLTSTGVSIGSPGYMSPEQILGKQVTGAADVFSLGAVLAYAALGESPFPGDSSAALLYKVVHEEPELGAMAGDLRDVVTHCLAKDPAARPDPAGIAWRLAPGGAGRAVATGWLPGPLVEEVSRAAVRLLDLEATAPATAPPRTPPQAESAPAAGVPLGVFGPPADQATGSHSGAAGSGPQDANVPDLRTAAGRPSVSPATPATAVPAGSRPARRVSCTVALAVAGALAAVMVGSAFLFDLLPSGGQDQGDVSAARPSQTSAPAPGDDGGGPTAGASAPGKQVGAVPDAFIGTWKGPTSERGGLPHGDYTAVFTKGAKGEDVLRTTNSLSVLSVQAECHSIGKLASGTDRQLRIVERSDPDRPGTGGLCTTAEAELTFTLAADGTLRYSSDEDAAGTPTGTLTRQ